MTLSTDDVLEIHQLAARYNHAVDAGDGPAFAATFVDDGVFDLGPQVLKGRDEISAFATGVPGALPKCRHMVSNVVVDEVPGEPGAAALKAYVMIYAAVGEGGSRALVQSGTYDDTLRRDDDGWRFVVRTFRQD
jgi:uncharacterized protein (TIGR02246 family)